MKIAAIHFVCNAFNLFLWDQLNKEVELETQRVL